MRIYFSGIGGVGIGPLAEIAHDAGYEVIGSDREAGLMTERLLSEGIEVSFDQSGEFFRSEHDKRPFDWFVYTAALRDDHPELVTARKLGVRVAKRDELLAHIIDEKNLKLIAVAGTHGKTTTTGMLVWALQQLGVPVSYSAGATLSFGPSGKFDPESEYFVYECDEFDRNFLHFRPWLSLITALDYDHPDTFLTIDDYRQAFVEFLEQSDFSLIWNKDVRYLKQPDIAADYEAFDELMDLSHIRLAGDHVRHNAFLAEQALRRLGLEGGIQAINNFPGTSRRFEKLAKNIYSDYGHHPKEIQATLQMARELSSDVVLVYQPHQNIRQHEIRDQYTDEVFQDASEIYWLPTYLSRENNLEILTPSELTKNLRQDNLHLVEFDDQLWQNVLRARDAGKLVLFMGAGSIDNWVREKLN